MSNFNFDKRRLLTEDDGCPSPISGGSGIPGGCGVPGGAYYNSAHGTVGGVSSPYQTTYNTIGIGNPIPAGLHSVGSGDRFDMNQVVIAKAKKKNKKG